MDVPLTAQVSNFLIHRKFSFYRFNLFAPTGTCKYQRFEHFYQQQSQQSSDANQPAPIYYCTRECQRGGCWCNEGLYKEDDGSCVPLEQCLNNQEQPTNYYY